MNKPKILIVEDEKPAARSLQRKIEQLGHAVTDMVHSVAQARAWLATYPEPDLIFMDIQLSDGLSFDILSDYPVESALIFTTAYDEFALRAFKLNSIDYLLKPIVEDELKNALEKYLKKRDSPQHLDVERLRQMLFVDTNKYKDRFTIKVGQNIRVVETQRIECFYSENKGTYLYTSGRDNYLMDHTIEQLERLLDPDLFFRINRGHIINITAIKDIAVHSNSRLKVILRHYPSQELIVSREKVADFKAWLG